MPTSRSRTRPNVVVLLALLCGLAVVALPAAHAATLMVINNDGPGEGFNDPTPVAPVGGNLGTTRGAQRLIAFQRAADIWGALLSSAVTIQVSATFDPLACNATSAILGSAGPTTAFRDFSGALVGSTWYPIALANALHGSDLYAGNDISAQFNSALGTTCAFPRGWYYGLDGNAGGNIDFVTILLHELTHGLGFVTLVDLGTGAKAMGLNDTFMLNLENHGASPADYPSMTNAQRVAASVSTGNLHWVGAHVRAASGILTAGTVGDHVRMFAPNPQQGGSSVSHWDTALTPDQLLEPIYTVPMDPGLELPLLQDIGWTVLSVALQVTPATNTAAAGFQGGPFSPSAFQYQLSTTTGSASFAISGVPSWLTASVTAGTATTSATTVTFTVNASANGLAPGTYGPATIGFTNTTNGQGNTTRTATLTVASSPAVGTTPLYRFFNVVTSTHFYTISEAEKNAVIATLPQYHFEGIAFYVFGSPAPQASPVYRFFNVVTGTHFYTINEAEKNAVIATLPQYHFEGIVFYAYPGAVSGTSPVYRFFNVVTGTHFYTISEAEKNSVIATLSQYHFEGAVYFAYAPP